jgi:hypothetical protein
MPLGFLLLNLNPYMLEFFSLARGYGLALGFMMCSIYFCLRYLESRERGPLNVFLASLFAGLSLLSSFPFVNYYFGMCAVVTVVTLSRLRSWPSGRLAFVFRNGFPLVFTSLVFIMISAPPMLKLRQVMPSLRQVEGFVVGGKVGFWEDTVLSLIRSSLYRQTYTDALVTPLAIVLMVMVVVGGGLFLYGMWRQWFDQRLALTFVAVPITLTIAASSILQHHLLGVEYLKDRIAVMFVPLVSLVVLASTAYVASAGQRPVVRNAGVLVLTLFTLGASLHTLKSFNVTHSLVLRGNASTRQVVDDLTAEHQASREQGLRGRLTLGSSPVYRPTIDYYTVSRKLTWLKSVNLLSPEADYVYYRPEDEPTVSEMSVTPLTVYPISDAVLAKKG